MVYSGYSCILSRWKHPPILVAEYFRSNVPAMTEWKLKTPVVLLIFNRPDALMRVFDVVAQVKPPKLLVVADGPRPDRPTDGEKCAAARAVVERVDWDCEVLTNYAEMNMGCQDRVSSGLTWAFDTVNEAIIVEDDCVPHPTFFPFCEALLERYRDDERVMVISGDNFQQGRKRTDDSYYFSRYPHCWGWASWRRAWQHYDHTMTLWPDIRDSGWLADVLQDPPVADYWTRIFQSTFDGKVNSWAYRWTFACFIQSGLTILPNVNLVSNIGFGAEATHTTGQSTTANMLVAPVDFPLRHPPFVIRDTQADLFTDTHRFKVYHPSQRLPLHSLVMQRVKTIGRNIIRMVGLRLAIMGLRHSDSAQNLVGRREHKKIR